MAVDYPGRLWKERETLEEVLPLKPLALVGAFLLAATPTLAQGPQWNKQCSVASPAVDGSPRMRLTWQKIAAEEFLSLHLVSDSAFTSEPKKFGGVSVKIEPSGVEVADLYGWTATGTENLFGTGVTGDFDKFLRSVSQGNTISVSATIDGETKAYQIDLTGSGVAINSLSRCME